MPRGPSGPGTFSHQRDGAGRREEDQKETPVSSGAELTLVSQRLESANESERGFHAMRVSEVGGQLIPAGYVSAASRKRIALRSCLLYTGHRLAKSATTRQTSPKAVQQPWF